MSRSKLAFRVTPSDLYSGLHFQMLFDESVIFSDVINDVTDITHEFDDNTNTEHVIKFVMTGKTSSHTTVDAQNQIVKDAVLTISNIEINNIDLDFVYFKHCIYCHSFNGNGPETSENFFGIMGCNGHVDFKFSTPVYLWLLEHV
jgi:hypothetical protein